MSELAEINYMVGDCVCLRVCVCDRARAFMVMKKRLTHSSAAKAVV